jgi:hypothetical protein
MCADGKRQPIDTLHDVVRWYLTEKSLDEIACRLRIAGVEPNSRRAPARSPWSSSSGSPEWPPAPVLQLLL